MTVPSDSLPVPLADEARIPIQRLGAGSDVVWAVVQSGHALIVTDDDREVAAIVDAVSYQQFRAYAARQLLLDLQAAAAGADAGNTVDHAQAMRRLRGVFAGHVPASLLSEFDAAAAP